jgi:hypothetical protein
MRDMSSDVITTGNNVLKVRGLQSGVPRARHGISPTPARVVAIKPGLRDQEDQRFETLRRNKGALRGRSRTRSTTNLTPSRNALVSTIRITVSEVMGPRPEDEGTPGTNSRRYESAQMPALPASFTSGYPFSFPLSSELRAPALTLPRCAWRS